MVPSIKIVAFQTAWTMIPHSKGTYTDQSGAESPRSVTEACDNNRQFREWLYFTYLHALPSSCLCTLVPAPSIIWHLQPPCDLELELLLVLGNPCCYLGTSEQEPELEPESMVGKLPPYFLVPVRWFQANNKDCPNPAKVQVQGHMVVASAIL